MLFVEEEGKRTISGKSRVPFCCTWCSTSVPICAALPAI